MIVDIADALEVKEPEKVIKQSQRILEVSDDTDLELAAQFDFANWLKGQNIAQGDEDSEEKIPAEIMKLKLRDTFVMPESRPLTLTGDIDLIFSSEIKIKDIATLTAEFAQNTSKEN